MNHRTSIPANITSLTLAVLFAGCTSEPLISRRGISTVAVAEVGVETLSVAAAAVGGGGGLPNDLGNLGISDTTYLGGIIPVKNARTLGDSRVDNGTRLSVDGRKRGFLPRILKLGKLGPHIVHLEIPAFNPYDLSLTHTVQLRIGSSVIEAWPPIIVDCLNGEIFTTGDMGTVNHDRNSGTHHSTALEKRAAGDPLLIVMTTDKRHPGWRKLGQLKTAWGAGGGCD